MNDIYTAIMKAADKVQNEPQCYDFWTNDSPDCGTTGCMIGWIGSFMGIPPGRNQGSMYTKRVAVALGHIDLMAALRAIDKQGIELSDGRVDFYDHDNTAHAAGAMRSYAAKYHAPAKPVQVAPDFWAMASKQTVATDVRSEDARVTI